MKKINFSKQPIIIKVCKSSTNHIGSNDLLYVAQITKFLKHFESVATY